jgi:hypothetical protein
MTSASLLPSPFGEKIAGSAVTDAEGALRSISKSGAAATGLLPLA